MSDPKLALETGVVAKHRVAVAVNGAALVKLSFQALGIIYSDIGTSPLYTLNGIWPASGGAPPREDVIGGVSAIIWAITLLPFLKYVIVSLYFGTSEGEGGSFALFQSLYPPVDKDHDADRTLTGDSYTNGHHLRTGSRIQDTLRRPLFLVALIGTSLTMADGVFTPAVSVTSAVGGIAVAKPDVLEHVIPISIAIIVALFAVQRFGTSAIAFSFGPISFIWFMFLAGMGIYNITLYPGVLRAFDPSRAVMLFVRTKNYDLLAGVLLALTGGEAIFANLGQFNAASIRLSFGTVVYPSLLLAYLGQGARLIVDGENVIQSVFYRSIPGPVGSGPLFWIVFVFAILATVVASQALITATFSLVQQVVNMKVLPPVLMLNTSDWIQGQVYIPAVNWILMIAVVICVAVFADLAALSNAYGFAIVTVMLITSLLLSFQIVWVKHRPVFLAIPFFLFFGFLDALFWGASVKKVPHGAWVPLVMGVVLTTLMVIWSWARGLEDAFDGANRQNLRHFICPEQKPDEDEFIATSTSVKTPYEEPGLYYLSEAPTREGSINEDIDNAKQPLARLPTCAIFHKLTPGRGVPHSFVGFIRQWPALPEVLIFLSISVVPVARVPSEERFTINKVRTVEGFYGVTYNLGFRDKFDIRTDELAEKICQLEMQVAPKDAARNIETIRRVQNKVTHIVPHYHVVSKKEKGGLPASVRNAFRSFIVETIYRRLATMFPETANWLTSADEIIHVGINAAI